MKDVLDYRLEVAAMRGLRVKAFKLSRYELWALLESTAPASQLYAADGGWQYKAIPLQVLDRA